MIGTLVDTVASTVSRPILLQLDIYHFWQVLGFDDYRSVFNPILGLSNSTSPVLKHAAPFHIFHFSKHGSNFDIFII